MSTPRLLSLLLCAALTACGSSGADTDTAADALDAADATDVAPDLSDVASAEAETTELPLTPTAGYLARQAEYLQVCTEKGATGGLYGQVCRVATGQSTYNETAIDASLAKIALREDTSDFHVAALARMLWLDRTTRALPDALRTRIEDGLLDFKYWLDEPNRPGEPTDKMCYWTENHQALFHSSELLAGLLFPDRVFANDGKTGAEHADHARPYVHRWLDLRGTVGFSEWHSNVYFNEDIPALVNLADFADLPEIRTKAAAVLDLVALDFLSNTYKGLWSTVHGRTYEGHLIPEIDDSTEEAAWLMLGLGQYGSKDNFSAAFLATNNVYAPAPLLEDLAAATTASFEHRQRDGFDVAEGPDFGIGYESDDDVVVWAGMAGIAAPPVTEGMVGFLDPNNLWGGFLFGDLPAEIKDVLLSMKGTPGKLKSFSTQLEPISRGMALESMSTYTWRTPDYQMSGAQDHRPGYWGTQTHLWRATLDKQAYVFTTLPGGISADAKGLEFAGDWIGGWNPRATLHRNVSVVQYRETSVPLANAFLTKDTPHAYFPRSGFDEVVESTPENGQWLFGRKGDAYVGLWSQNPAAWVEGVDPATALEAAYEWDVAGPENVFVCELGSKTDSGSFKEFVDALTTARVEVGDVVTFDSPSLGTVEVGWTGAMTVDGQAVDLGPYPRWDNAHATQVHGEDRATITLDDRQLQLDVTAGVRRMVAVP